MLVFLFDNSQIQTQGNHALVRARTASLSVLAFVLAFATTYQLHGQSRNPLPPPPAYLPPFSADNYFEDNSDAFVAGSNASTSPFQVGNYFDSPDSPFSVRSQDQTWNKEILGASTIARFRKSFYQKSSVRGGWLAKDGDMDLGRSYFRSSVMLAVGKAENLILVAPSFNMDFLEGPTNFDVPGTLYDAYLDLIWRMKLNSRWGTLLSVRPGVFSDNDSSFGSGYRTSGFAAVSWDVFPEQLSLFAGVVYLNRNDYDLLPAGGLIWTPTSDLRVELMFPKPKISKRIAHVPFVSEDWMYVAATFDGGTYEVRRSNGMQDELTLRDFRVALGFERVKDGGAGWHAELGWVFGRRLEYASDSTRIEFEDRFGVEAGFSF